MPKRGHVPWPAEVARSYVAAGHWRQRPLGSLLWEWAGEYGDRVAIVDGDRRITYRGLAERVDALADALHGRDLAVGDSMLVQLPNGADLVLVFLAGLRSGVAPVMMLPSHRDLELSAVAVHAGVGAIVVADSVKGYDHQSLARRTAANAPTVHTILVSGTDIDPGSVALGPLTEPDGDVKERRDRLDGLAPDPGEVALFLLSGGSTGLPKLITRTHNDYEYNSRRSGEVCGFDADTVYLASLPAGHNFPLGCPGILGTLMVGGRVVMLPSPAPAAVFEAIRAEGVTVTSAVPAVATRWAEAALDTGPDLSSLRTVQVGGSLFTADAARHVRDALGCQVQQVYGMAEGLLNYTRPEDGDVALATQGRPISADDELLIVDADDRPVPDGEVGELLTRGPYTPRGYFAAPEHNARAFTPDGFFRTGDLVRRHPGGNLVVVGRAKDVINRGGEKIGADEVERLVQLLPGVAEAVAVPWPDPVLGERICVYVRLRPGGAEPTLAEARDLFTAHGVAAFKHPERLETVDELPRTAVGKIDKPELRRRAAGAALAAH